ncbi:hypothetical protein JOF53_001498 [Crossiella equi]|uniref:Uncharacterized protein n=1 Tax=Crossiella equi TaxID=130796 RepID=A0ABS5A8I6_9PSEU|nr:hypothetical protein [Crossiella equi]MBP2472626.1 hypothetical protein [Crossiella equi]
MRQQERTRDRVTVSSRLVLTVLFTAVQAWALVLLVGRYSAQGFTTEIALSLALGGAVLAVVNAWEEVVLSSRRDSRQDR